MDCNVCACNGNDFCAYEHGEPNPQECLVNAYTSKVSAADLDASIPEEILNSRYVYDPGEDAVAAVPCLICGEDVTIKRVEHHGPRICRRCKAAVLEMRIKLGI